MIESMPSPRELAEMIVNAQYDPKEPNLEILVDELHVYMKDGYPRKTAENDSVLFIYYLLESGII